MSDAELPAGWAHVRLEEIAEVRLGRQRSPKNHAGDQMRPYLRAANIKWTGLSLGDVKEMNFTDSEAETYRLLPGDILLSEASGSASEVGKSALWAGQITECCFQNTLIRVRAASGVDPSYLLHFLRHEALRGSFAKGSRGVGIHHLGAAKLAAWRIPLPSRAEQHRIVEALEGHLSRLDAALNSLKRATQRIESLRGSLMFSALRTSEATEGWASTTIGELATVGTGATPLKSRADYYADGAVPWITSTSLNSPTITKPDKFVTELAVEQTSIKLYPAGTILVAMYGEGKTRGKSSELTFPATTNQACAAIILNKDSEFRKPWIKLVLESKYRELRRLASGGVQPNLNLTLIRNISIPLPSPATQDSLLNTLDAQSTALHRLQNSCGNAQRGSQLLRRAILSQAFTGKLVPQDPADEPTSALLNRIRAEREAQPKRTRRPRTTPRTPQAAAPTPTPAPRTAIQQEFEL
ncbi:restriction endonuclease subunit S [Streptomyces sp. NBC_01306]|uniref:restriction endonuclease subunit S n=1 Tax=Streptomyces sp. NBC_01306 TaxID=2903819 RepID=UPI0022535774|nr:restriction endonuclease subunit S [Streptomyces sp. NBC_01306]MCX4724923.1 restriction endonuclease subunit S [Streptomyces sp. NBC_01306]